MRRHAKILCGFGSIEVLCSLIALFVVFHMHPPWGVVSGGLGHDEWYTDEALRWQLDLVVCSFGIALMGALFLLVGCITYLVSKLIPMHKFKSGRISQ